MIYFKIYMCIYGGTLVKVKKWGIVYYKVKLIREIIIDEKRSARGFRSIIIRGERPQGNESWQAHPQKGRLPHESSYQPTQQHHLPIPPSPHLCGLESTLPTSVWINHSVKPAGFLQHSGASQLLRQAKRLLNPQK